MKRKKLTMIVCAALSALTASAQTDGKWTLQQCLDYALSNNISLKQNKISEQSSAEDVKTAKAALFPSLSLSMSQGLTYRPLQESSNSYVSGGVAVSSKKKVTENGSYSLSANWTVWNGGRNTKNIKAQELNSQIATLTTEQTANSIQEQIAQLYVQILYSNEAVKVNEEVLKTSIVQRDRGAERVKVGDLAKSDLAQLEAQVTTDQYNVVNAQAQVANYKLQLKQLLELSGEQEFDIAEPMLEDEAAMSLIPSKMDVYNTALSFRPEIKSGELNIEAADINIDIAKAGYYPTVGLNAGIGASHTSASSENVGAQFRNNLNGTLGLTVSVPIFDNRSNKSAVSKAKLNRLSSDLDLLDQKKKLYSSIESIWLDATSAQQKFVAANANVKSTQSSYELTNEQFRLGLKNIVELMTSKDNLLTATQDKLQSKYTTILNMQLLKFYQGEGINL